MYQAYECLICKTVFIIPIEDVERMQEKGKYIACNFGHKKVKKLGKYNNILECMQQYSYARENGRMKQKR